MQIANRVGIGSLQQQGTAQGPGTPAFTVTIGGLTDNPTHGSCAQRGSTLTAQITGAEASGYQWHIDGAPIAGATGQSLVVGPELADLGAILCAVTVGSHTRNSPAAVLREVPPALQGSLADEVFDHDIGPQSVPTAQVFSGVGLVYAVSGAGASIDTVTGEVSIPTATEFDGLVVTVSASNSGGVATAGFQVTVEETIGVEGAVPFGALTPAGSGGIPVAGSSITSGDPGGHWQISDGRLAPSAAGAGALAGTYTLQFNNGDRLDVVIQADKASARPEELATVFAGLPLSARGLLLQDGDARAVGRQRLVAKAFTHEMVIEPTNWIEDADPRESARSVILSGLTIGGDPSGAALERMENLTVQGLICQMQQGGGETEHNNGIIRVERPSRHVTIRQNEIWSRDVAEIVLADDFRDHVKTSRQMRGISTSVYKGKNDHIRIEDNYIHDVSRGVIMTSTNSYQGVRSRLCGNIIEDCYTNFFTCGSLDGLDIFDNRCMGVYAANGDTLGPIPASSPHSSVGGSFDPGSGARDTQNITMMGNLLHIGWKRTKLHEDQGLSTPTIGATGVKFNDPVVGDNYWNIVVAFNTVVAHNICLELAGAGADQNILVFNNTLASENYANRGSGGPVYYFAGAQNVRLWNNIGVDYTLGALDGSGFYASTLETLEGYGNLKINSGGVDFGEADYFVGAPAREAIGTLPARPAGSLAFMTIDEAMAAYVPKSTRPALTSEQKKGALGTGLYSGNGVHSAIYDKPVASGGTANALPVTVWDGSVYMSSSNSTVSNPEAYASSYLFAWEGAFDAATDGNEVCLFATQFNRIRLLRETDNRLALLVSTSSGGTVCDAKSSFKVTANDGMVRIAISYDAPTGRIIFVKNGDIDPMTKVSRVRRGDLHFQSKVARFHADTRTGGQNRFIGQFAQAYWSTEYFELDTAAGLNALFTETGAFRDFGADGAGVTGAAPLLYIRGDAASMANYGTGWTMALKGSATLTNASNVPTGTGLQFNEGASGGNFTTVEGFRVWDGAHGDTLVMTGAGTLSGIELVGGGGGGGFRAGGGGGGGELVQATDVPVTAQTYTAVVGSGGTGSTAVAVQGGSGGSTRLVGGSVDDISLTALGGGGGGSLSVEVKDGAAGGSGGGASGHSGAVGGASNAADGVGFAGGGSGSSKGGGGGGGAGGAGITAVDAAGQAGGAGVASIVPGRTALYAAGGAGGPTIGSADGAAGVNPGDGGQGGCGSFGSREGGAGAAGRVTVWMPLSSST